MFNIKLSATLTGIVLALSTVSTNAGIKLQDEKSGVIVDLGGRLQVMSIFNDSSFKPDESIDFKIRRARARLNIEAHPMLSMFMQTEFTDDAGGAGGDVRIIDAYVKFKIDAWVQVFAGLNMAPVQRQAVTSSAALMTMDRPGITNYNLTWGLKGNTALQTGTVPGTRIGTFGDNQVRDTGVTLFGSGANIDDSRHFKYYLGVAEGSKYSADTLRFSARAQINFGDAEPSYYNSSTYLGKKDTIGIGVAIDIQNDFATDFVTGEQVNYSLFTIDAFVEKPLGGGSLTMEAAYTSLELEGGVNELADQSGDVLVAGATADRTQGDGFYIQSGYLIGSLQPFIMLEQWQSDAENEIGSWCSLRLGLNYYLKDHNANIKFAVENTSIDANNVADISTAAIGFYLNF
jgi:hypothetical protein